MIRVATIFLLLPMLLLQTPAGQLLKLPFLIGHFVKHQEAVGTSLLAFLQEHYSAAHQDKDAAEDQQLPFKQIAFHSLDGATEPPSFTNNNSIPTGSLPGKTMLPASYHPQQHLCSIFHPPRPACS